MRAKWGPRAPLGREEEAEAEEEGEEEEEGSEPGHTFPTFRHIPSQWTTRSDENGSVKFWGRCVRSGHPEESAQTDSDI